LFLDVRFKQENLNLALCSIDCVFKSPRKVNRHLGIPQLKLSSAFYIAMCRCPLKHFETAQFTKFTSNIVSLNNIER
jgi:hypothetical protein